MMTKILFESRLGEILLCALERLGLAVILTEGWPGLGLVSVKALEQQPSGVPVPQSLPDLARYAEARAQQPLEPATTAFLAAFERQGKSLP